jgi:phosphomevalonate kinase
MDTTDRQLDDFSPINAQLKHIRGAIEGVRKGMRDMSLASGVPIEPKEQTRLLDECSKLPGVLGGGVPGGKLTATRVQNQS